MLRIHVQREWDGRWIAQVPAIPGLLAYGTTEAAARKRVEGFAMLVINERVKNGEPLPHELATAMKARKQESPQLPPLNLPRAGRVRR
jgi:predicted RNase H-like HicB family nuclease